MDAKQQNPELWRPYELTKGDVNCGDNPCTIHCAVPNYPIRIDTVRLKMINMNFENGEDILAVQIKRRDVHEPTVKEAFIKTFRLNEDQSTVNNPMVLKQGRCTVAGCHCFFDQPLNPTRQNGAWARINFTWEVISEPTEISEFSELDGFQITDQMDYDLVRSRLPKWFKLLSSNGGGPYKVQIRRRFEARIKFAAKLYDYTGKCRSVL